MLNLWGGSYTRTVPGRWHCSLPPLPGPRPQTIHKRQNLWTNMFQPPKTISPWDGHTRTFLTLRCPSLKASQKGESGCPCLPPITWEDPAIEMLHHEAPSFGPVDAQSLSTVVSKRAAIKVSCDRLAAAARCDPPRIQSRSMDKKAMRKQTKEPGVDPFVPRKMGTSTGFLGVMSHFLRYFGDFRNR